MIFEWGKKSLQTDAFGPAGCGYRNRSRRTLSGPQDVGYAAGATGRRGASCRGARAELTRAMARVDFDTALIPKERG